MVGCSVQHLALLATEASPGNAEEQTLPLEYRAALLMALLAILLLGGLVAVVARLGARSVRRAAGQRQPHSLITTRNQWYREPLPEADDDPDAQRNPEP